MKITYAESTFYGDLEKLYERKLDKKSFNEEYKKLVEKELPNDLWLQNHFSSTTEYIAELEDVTKERDLEDMIDVAYFEIDVMRKSGNTRQADLMKKWLEDAIKDIR